MDLIPEEELNPKSLINLTPLVDFLFLVIAVLAILAVTKTALFDTEVSLARLGDKNALYPETINPNAPVINLGITEKGQYKWITEFNEYGMENDSSVLQELSAQKQLGLIPKDPSKTKILLHVDKKAEWDCVVRLIFSLRKNGYRVHPVYEAAPS